MHFDISSNATHTTILPEENFYLGIIDNHRIGQGSLFRHPGLVETTTPCILITGQEQIKPGILLSQVKKLLQKGIRRIKPVVQWYSCLWKILSDTESAGIIQQLKVAGDTEGGIPYNSSAEFFIEALATAGMGGGVFNAAGQLLGVVVEASDKEKAPKIIRVLKVSYIKSKMVEFYNRLPEISKHRIRPFISREL